MFAAVDYIRETLKGLDSAYPFDVEFYDEIFDNLYHKEDALRDMITVLDFWLLYFHWLGYLAWSYLIRNIGERK